MPSVTIHPPGNSEGSRSFTGNPLPELLQTPSGLAILELQGSIHMTEVSDAPNDDASTNGQSTTVGRLVFPDYSKDNPSDSRSWMKRVHLYVGRHQRLTGEAKKLANPMAIIRRRDAVQSGGSGEELEIADIVYYKIIFSSRPEPVSG